MIPPRFPFLNYPYNFYNINRPKTPSSVGVYNNHKSLNFVSNMPKSDYNTQPTLKPEPEDTKYFFDIFGLKLYFDDILIICLLFFLYDEGVKDSELFISLVLLLISP